MKDRHQINIDTKNLIETVAGAAFSHGLVPDAQADFIKERGDKQLIVIAATPKSGSTFLANTLSKITGLNYFRLCAAYSTNEHDLYLPALCLINPYGCVSQLHMKGTFHNAALMRTFGVKPVILVRQILRGLLITRHLSAKNTRFLEELVFVVSANQRTF